MKFPFFLFLLAVPSAALAQNASSGAQRVQGAPDGYGSPVQVTIVGPDGADVSASTAIGAVTATGNVAHDAADSGAPVKIGCYASDTAPAAVTAADRVNGWCSRNGSGISTLSDIAGSLVGVSGLSGDDGSQFIIGLNTASYLLAFDGTDNDRLRGDRGGLAVQSGLVSTWWKYAAASGGIVNTTTAVTIKAAPGANVCNVVKSLTLSHDTLGGATEVALRDGAAGTVMWRGRLQTTAVEDATITFDPPLKATANTLVEVVTLTAVTGGVYANASGYTVPC